MVMLMTPLATARTKIEVRMVATDERLSLARFLFVFLRPVFDSPEKKHCAGMDTSSFHTGDFVVVVHFVSIRCGHM